MVDTTPSALDAVDLTTAVASDAAADGEALPTPEGAGKVVRAPKVRKPRAQVPRGNVYVHASYNNTIVTVADPNGNVLAWASAGASGFRGPRKATPYAAGAVVREVLRKLEGSGLREVSAFIRGVGPGREAAVRALHANGLTVVAIKDVTPIPHNGCRPPKPRRI